MHYQRASTPDENEAPFHSSSNAALPPRKRLKTHRDSATPAGGTPPTPRSPASTQLEAAPGRYHDMHQLKVSTKTRQFLGLTPSRKSTNLIHLPTYPPALHLRVSSVRALAYPRRSAQLESPVTRLQHHANCHTVGFHYSSSLPTLSGARHLAQGDEHCIELDFGC